MADLVNVEKRRLRDETSALNRHKMDAQHAKLEATSKLQEVEQMKRTVEQSYADLADEQAAFKEEKKIVSDIAAAGRDILRINVGG